MPEKPEEAELPVYRSEHFVGRHEELRKIQKLVDALTQGERPRDRVLAFVGEVGTGKTWLMRRIKDLLIDAKVRVLSVDLLEYLDEPASSIVEILKEMNRQLTGSEIVRGSNPVEVSRHVMESIQKYAENEMIALLLDHVYETDWDLLTYVDQYLLSPFAPLPRTLIVLTGRGRPYPWKTPEVPFQKPSQLKHFDEKLTQLQVEKQIPDPKVEKERVYVYSSGFPMQNYFLARLGFPQGLEVSLNHIFKPVHEDERLRVREYLESLCVLDSFDEEKLAWMIGEYTGQQLSHLQAREIREKLVRYGFAKWAEEASGYVMDESVRLTVGNLLQHGNPKEWVRLHSAADSYIKNLRAQYEHFPVEQTVSHHLQEAFFSALATPELIGRVDELEKLQSLVGDRSQSYIMYVYGPGGVGKTRLLKEFLKWLRGRGAEDVLVATDLVDLFHTVNRTEVGIAQRISEVLDPEFQGLSMFREERAKYLDGLSQGRAQSPDRMLKALLEELNAIAQTRRIILFLDTVERFLYKDPAAVKMGLPDDYLPGQGWILKEFLPNLHNSVVVIAGRSPQEDVRGSLKKILAGKEFEPMPLRGLNKQEAIDYFGSVATAAGRGGLVTPAAALEDITSEERERIYETLWAADPYNGTKEHESHFGVRPLWLSLVIDYYILEGKLPDLVHQVIPDDLIKAALTANRPGSELLPYIGLAVKGATDELLGAIMSKMKGKPWDQEYVAAYLNSDPFSSISFVKARREGNKIFINFHDEIYDWVKRNFEHLVDENSKEDVFETIRRYHKERIDSLEDDVSRYAVATGEISTDPTEREYKAAQLRRFRLDDFYYRLINAKDIEKAFDTYYVSAEDALAAQDVPLENMLTAEMQAHIHEVPDKFRKSIADCPFEEVNAADAAIRWLKRDLLREEANAQDTMQLIGPTAIEGDHLARIEFDLWQGQFETYRGNHARAKELLIGSRDSLEQIAKSLRRNAILGKAYSFLGYLARVEGRYKAAVLFYTRAVEIWREIGTKRLEADTRNNLAFVYAELGDLEPSYNMIWDAYQLRAPGGHIPIGLTLNTLAHVHIRDDRPDEAAKYAQEALRRFQVARYERGEGLANVVLAEAERRQTEIVTGNVSVERLLERAIKHGEDGAKIFMGYRFREPERLIEAHIETGCAYRDRAKFQRDHILGEKALESAKYADDHFSKAVKLAEQTAHEYRYMTIDALINRAWLKYYMNPRQENNEVFALLEEIETMVPEGYRINLDNKFSSLPPESQIVSPYLLYLGKLEVLRGQIIFYRWEKDHDELTEAQSTQALKQIARHYARSLCYNMQFSEKPSRSTARAKRRMYERLRQLNGEEVQVVVEESSNNLYGGRNFLLELLQEYALVRR
jgi:Cdc6-like AAA superfamily ATPase